jgi:hypothetical protein
MAEFLAYPEKLREVLEIFDENPGERNQMLMVYCYDLSGLG